MIGGDICGLRHILRPSLRSRGVASFVRGCRPLRFLSHQPNKPTRRDMASSDPIEINGKQYRAVKEGLASVLAPYRIEGPSKGSKGKNNDEGDQAVFYNPIQQFNRDLSVLAILTYGEGAVVEKGARAARAKQNSKQKKKARKDRETEPQSKTSAINGKSEQPNHAKKRKADELDQDGDGETSKKARVDDFEADEDELEVMQLNGTSHDQAGMIEEGQKDNDTTQPVSKRTAFTILDALAATGLRALRYAKEIPFATNIIANDVSMEAVKSIELNIDHNEVGRVVHSNVGDARAYMYSKVADDKAPSDRHVQRFDVIDLDPYGTAAPFFDASLQALQDGGLLCVTCTDAGVFASNGYPEKAFALYRGIPAKGAYSHEGGMRLILNAIATSAAGYGIAIEPLLSLSIDFYVRLFIRVHKSPKDVKLLPGTTMLVYNCDAGCGAWTTQPLARNQGKEDKVGTLIYKYSVAQAPLAQAVCEHCRTKTHLAGPMWAGPLHNPYFVQRILDRIPSLDNNTYTTLDRLKGMLTLALEEDLTLASSNIPANTSAPRSNPNGIDDSKIIPRLPPSVIDATPFFFLPTFLAKIVHCNTPTDAQFRGALRHLGYRVTRSHCKAGGMKTNAPWTVIWEVMREWVRQKSPIKEGSLKRTSPGWKIMNRARGSETRWVDTIKGGMTALLESAETKEELTSVLKGALYGLETERIPSVEDEEKTALSPEQQSRSTAMEQPNKVDVLPKPGPKVNSMKIVFDEDLGKELPRGRLVRYQMNPRENWGPMHRAAGS